MALERNDKGQLIVRLDGSMGLGPMAKLSVTTLDKINGPTTHVFEVPYAAVDIKVLQNASDRNYILGYGIEKLIDPSQPPDQFVIGIPQEDIQ